MKNLALMLTFATAALAQAGAPAKVLLLPFDSAGPAEKLWIAKAVQQNMVAELSRVNSVSPIFGVTPANNLEAALKFASEAGADFVIFGSYQAVDADLRITGQVIDVAKKQAIAGLKTTGAQRDLFGMEDILAAQVKRALPQPVPEAQPEMLKQPQPAPAVQPNGPVVMNNDQKLKDLENQIDRAINRLRYAPDFGPDYAYPYFYSGYYTPYYYTYPGYYYPHRHCYNNNYGGNYGLSISGSYVGSNVSGAFSYGTGSYSGGGTVSRNYIVPMTANYAVHGPVTARR